MIPQAVLAQRQPSLLPAFEKFEKKENEKKKKLNKSAKSRSMHEKDTAAEANAFLQTIVGSISEGIIVQSRSGLVFANKYAARMCGFDSVEEYLSATPAKIMERFELLSEDGSPYPLSNLPNRRVLAGEKVTEPVTVRYRVKATGEEFWSVIRSEPVHGPDGEVLYALNVFHDITKEKRQERLSNFINKASAVLSSSLDHRVIIQNVSDLVVPDIADWCGVTLMRDDGTLDPVSVVHFDPAKVRWAIEYREKYPATRESSPSTFRIIETGKAELYKTITNEMLEAGSQGDPQRLKVIQELGMCSAMAVPLTARGKTYGVLSFVSAESKRQFDETDLSFAEDLGRRIGIAIANAHLYQEARDALDEQFTTQEALKRSEYQYRLLLERLPVGAYTCDAEGRITYFNPQAEAVWGRAPKLNDLSERFSGAFKIYSSEGSLIKREESWMAKALETGHSYWGKETVLERPDGSRITGLTHISPIHESGRIVGAVNIFVDITKLKRVEQAKSEFVSLASHQLRTPLTAVRWALDALQSERAGALTEFQREMVADAAKCSLHMSETIATMLMISRIEADDLELEIADVHIAELLGEIHSEQKPMFHRRQQSVSFECSDDLVIPTDRKILKEIATNLVSNAVKYTPKNGRIRISARREGNHFWLEVEDNGYGIPKDQHDRIFTKFFRAQNVVLKEKEGTGLGLYLVKLLMDLLKGDISFVSEEEKGTTFRVQISPIAA